MKNIEQKALDFANRDFSGLASLWAESKEGWENLTSRQKVGLVAGSLAIFGALGATGRSDFEAANITEKNNEYIMDMAHKNQLVSEATSQNDSDSNERKSGQIEIDESLTIVPGQQTKLNGSETAVEAVNDKIEIGQSLTIKPGEQVGRAAGEAQNPDR